MFSVVTQYVISLSVFFFLLGKWVTRHHYVTVNTLLKLSIRKFLIFAFLGISIHFHCWSFFNFMGLGFLHWSLHYSLNIKFQQFFVLLTSHSDFFQYSNLFSFCNHEYEWCYFCTVFLIVCTLWCYRELVKKLILGKNHITLIGLSFAVFFNGCRYWW